MAESKVEIALIANASKLRKGLKEGEKASKGFFQTIKKHQKALAVGFAASAVAIAGVIKGIKTLATAAGVQQLAESNLEQALAKQGETRRGVIQGMKDHAAALQKITTYGDEQNLEIMALLSTLGVQTGMLKEVTGLTLDMATAMKMDATAAAQLMGKAIGGGQVSALSRYGIILDKNIPKTEQTTALIEKLQAMMGGRAAAAADTYAGRMTQFSNAMGDLGEKVGDLLIPALTTAAEKLIPVVDKVGQWIGLLVDLHNWLMRIGESSDANAKSAVELEKAIDIEGRAIEKLIARQIGWTDALHDLEISEETHKELLDELDEKILVHVKRSREYEERLKKVKAAMAAITEVIPPQIEKVHELALAYLQMMDDVRDLGYTIRLAVDTEIATKFAEAWAEAMQHVRDDMDDTGDKSESLSMRIQQSLLDILARSIDAWIEATAVMFGAGQNFAQSMAKAMASGMISMMRMAIKMAATEIIADAIAKKAKAIMGAWFTGGVSLGAIPIIAAASAAAIGALNALEGKLSMPSFAMGGTVQRTGPAMVHEGEVIVNPRMPGKGQEALAMAGGGGASIVFNNYGTISGDDAVAWIERSVARAMGAR